MARSTTEESVELVDRLQGMIPTGEPNTACLAYARHAWGSPKRKATGCLRKPGLRSRTTSMRPALIGRSSDAVHPDADGRGWAGNAAEETGRRGKRLPPARSHHWHWVQLPPLPWRTSLKCTAAVSCRRCVAKSICNTFRQVSGERTHGIHLPSFRSEWTSLNKLVDD